MGATSINQSSVIVAMATPPFLWFNAVQCVTVWLGGGGGGGDHHPAAEVQKEKVRLDR